MIASGMFRRSRRLPDGGNEHVRSRYDHDHAQRQPRQRDERGSPRGLVLFGGIGRGTARRGARPGDRAPQVQTEQHEEGDPHPLRQTAAVGEGPPQCEIGHCGKDQEQRARHLDPALAADELPLDRHAADQDRQSQDQAGIGDDRTDGIAERQAGRSLHGGQHADGRFRKRRAHADDGGADEHLRDAQAPRQRNGLIDQDVGALREHRQRDDDRDQQADERRIGGDPGQQGFQGVHVGGVLFVDARTLLSGSVEGEAVAEEVSEQRRKRGIDHGARDNSCSW